MGTTDALRAVLEEDGWSLDPVLEGFGGALIAFTMWWPCFVLPAGTALHHRRERSFVFCYSHMLVFASITKVCAGLRVYAAYLSETHARSNPTVIIAIAVPVTAYTLMFLFLYGYMLKVDMLHVWIAVLSVAAGLGAVLLVTAGSPP